MWNDDLREFCVVLLTEWSVTKWRIKRVDADEEINQQHDEREDGEERTALELNNANDEQKYNRDG